MGFPGVCARSLSEQTSPSSLTPAFGVTGCSASDGFDGGGASRFSVLSSDITDVRIRDAGIGDVGIGDVGIGDAGIGDGRHAVGIEVEGEVDEGAGLVGIGVLLK